jgi:Zn-dependent M28 family amino/carboxypeptidase
VKRALAIAVLAACGDDAATAPDARPDAPPGCERPALDAPWLPSLLDAAIAELAAAPRETATERDAARTTLTGQLTAIGWTPQLHVYPGGANVYATIPATLGAGPTVILGAHLDTIAGSPGANDDASGAAVVLAVAR